MKTFVTIRPASLVIALYLTAVLLIIAAEGWRYIATLHPYSVGDWLINYQGGFVRRGFVGEISLLLSNYFGVSQLIIIYILQIGCYAVFYYLSYRLILLQKSLCPFYLLIFAPFTFDFPIFWTGLRKDVFYLLIIAAAAHAASTKGGQAFLRVYYVLLSVYPLVVLSHEASIAFLPYVVATLFVVFEAPEPSHLIRTALLTSLSAIAFLAVALAKADWETVRQICESLESVAPSDCVTLDHTGAITWLAVSIGRAMQSVVARIKWDGYLSLYPTTLMMVMIGFAPAYRHLALLLRHRAIVLLTVCSLAATAGLATVMLDWGRLIHLQAVSLSLLCLTVGNRVAAEAISPRSAREVSGGSVLLERRLLLSGFALLLLAYSTTWNVTLCCTHEMGMGVLALIHEAVLNWLKHGTAFRF